MPAGLSFLLFRSGLRGGFRSLFCVILVPQLLSYDLPHIDRKLIPTIRAVRAYLWRQSGWRQIVREVMGDNSAPFCISNLNLLLLLHFIRI